MTTHSRHDLAAQTPESRMANIVAEIHRWFEMQTNLSHLQNAERIANFIDASAMLKFRTHLVQTFPFMTLTQLCDCNTIDDFRTLIFQKVGG